jgi:hypothetical protein
MIGKLRAIRFRTFLTHVRSHAKVSGIPNSEQNTSLNNANKEVHSGDCIGDARLLASIRILAITPDVRPWEPWLYEELYGLKYQQVLTPNIGSKIIKCTDMLATARLKQNLGPSDQDFTVLGDLIFAVQRKVREPELPLNDEDSPSIESIRSVLDTLGDLDKTRSQRSTSATVNRTGSSRDDDWRATPRDYRDGSLIARLGINFATANHTACTGQ